MKQALLQDVSWERMISAVERVRGRLLRATAALERAEIPYAVIGGNAIAAWVSRVDEAAVRNTKAVDLLLQRENLPAAIRTLESAGFVYRHALRVDRLLDGPDGKVRDGIHLVFAGEKVREHYSVAAPQVSESEATPTFRLLSLEALVRMKLTSFRDRDRVHLRDLIEAGLVDSGWCGRFQEPLSSRLQELIAFPED
jgi:hypothetical protein